MRSSHDDSLDRPESRREAPRHVSAIDELERSAQMGAPVTLLTPPGIDPVPYAALVHIAGRHPERPFVVVDAADPEEQQGAIWRDPESSPLCLADGGSLMILERGRALGRDATLPRRSPHRTTLTGRSRRPLEIPIIVSVPTSIDVLVASGNSRRRWPTDWAIAR